VNDFLHGERGGAAIGTKNRIDLFIENELPRLAGGDVRFCLGVAIDARERDLLVCDCPRELHGTLPLRGTRYSVVAYTKEGLTRAGTGRVLDYKTHEKLWSY